MTKEEQHYIILGNEQQGAEQSQMFGKPCFKVNGKAFISFFNNTMVFKLNDDAHREALSLDKSVAFDPSGKNRPMKEWVQVDASDQDKWKEFTAAAFEYVKTLK
jgi:hypothetical protein